MGRRATVFALWVVIAVGAVWTAVAAVIGLIIGKTFASADIMLLQDWRPPGGRASQAEP